MISSGVILGAPILLVRRFLAAVFLGLISSFQAVVAVRHALFPHVIYKGLEVLFLAFITGNVHNHFVASLSLFTLVLRQGDGFLVGIENNAHPPFLHNKKCAKHASRAVGTTHYIYNIYIVNDFPEIS